jgi:hypothetical protein
LACAYGICVWVECTRERDTNDDAGVLHIIFGARCRCDVLVNGVSRDMRMRGAPNCDRHDVARLTLVPGVVDDLGGGGANLVCALRNACCVHVNRLAGAKCKSQCCDLREIVDRVLREGDGGGTLVDAGRVRDDRSRRGYVGLGECLDGPVVVRFVGGNADASQLLRDRVGSGVREMKARGRCVRIHQSVVGDEVVRIAGNKRRIADADAGACPKAPLANVVGDGKRA